MNDDVKRFALGFTAVEVRTEWQAGVTTVAGSSLSWQSNG